LGLSAEMDDRMHLAVMHCEEAAQKGDIAAQMTLGEMCQKGRGVQQSIALGISLAEKSCWTRCFLGGQSQ